GTVGLDGQHWLSSPLQAEGGPGGFRGGVATFGPGGPTGGAGLGPGGGGQQSNAGGPGGYGTNGNHDTADQRGLAYGNPSLIPLIGGSGGAADPEIRGDAP